MELLDIRLPDIAARNVIMGRQIVLSLANGELVEGVISSLHIPKDVDKMIKKTQINPCSVTLTNVLVNHKEVEGEMEILAMDIVDFGSKPSNGAPGMWYYSRKDVEVAVIPEQTDSKDLVEEDCKMATPTTSKSPPTNDCTGKIPFPKKGARHYSAKYYHMSESTKQEFWMRESSPPGNVKVYPVGHPKNPGVQNVWRATDREINYWDSKKFVLQTVSSEDIAYNEDKNFYNVTRPHVIFHGSYALKDRPVIEVEPMALETKMAHLEEVVCQHGYSSWARFYDSFGSSIGKIVMDYACTKAPGRRKVLLLCGSNFQGAAGVAAARFLASFNMDVSIVCVATQGSEARYQGSNWNDLKYEKVKVVFDLMAIKNQKFQIVVLAVDDQDSPNSTVYVYREWMRGATVLLIDPPLINESYRRLIDDMCGKRVDDILLVNSIRPSPTVLRDNLTMLVVNFPTSVKYPSFGTNVDYNAVVPYDYRNNSNAWY